MGIKNRLIIMSFLQFFVWGAWLITIGTYCFNAKGWTGAQFGAVFSTLALSSLFMPAITGIIADKWLNAERLYGILHIFYGIILFMVPMVNDPDTLYYVIFGAMICYMPTISLSNSIAYNILKRNNFDVIKVFPPIRVWGTIGFIVAMWITNLSGSKANANQFIIAAFAAIALGVYSFTLPKCPPQKSISKDSSFIEMLGLKAFKLFGNYKMAVFFIFAMFLGGALQLTNMYGDTYISDFEKVKKYADLILDYQNIFLPTLYKINNIWDKIHYVFNYPKLLSILVIKYSTIIMSISQISETVFILAIPFFLKRLGIKKVMIISMIAWVLRFGLFAYGNPSDGLWMIILSCIVYGMAFDFFNISGSLFVETTTDSSIRSSAQGLFMMMTNGFGAYFGSKISGFVIDRYYTTAQGKDWHGIWLSFAIYSAIVAILFAVFFKHKHDPNALKAAELKH
ncbi:MAG: nucleoside permease [Bacteroidetes bacterium]|nr:nucleoside permease [Bacteroidota bacterium]